MRRVNWPARLRSARFFKEDFNIAYKSRSYEPRNPALWFDAAKAPVDASLFRDGRWQRPKAVRRLFVGLVLVLVLVYDKRVFLDRYFSSHI